RRTKRSRGTRLAAGSASAAAQRRPSPVNSRCRRQGQPSWLSSACKRCAHRVRSSASALRSRVRSRSSWISAGANHASGSICFPSKSAPKRASSRSVFGLRFFPFNARSSVGSARRTSSPTPCSSRATQPPPRRQPPPHPAPTSRPLHRPRRQPLPPTHRPIGERLRRSLEPLLDELARFRVERRRLKHVLVDVDHRVKHSLGPPLGFVLERDPTAGRGRPPS